MMTILTITPKGQITLRKDLLRHLGVGPGQKISLDKWPNGKIVLEPKIEKGSISDFIGYLYETNGPKLTINEINDLAEQGWSKSK